MTKQAAFLTDAFYMYAIALNKTLNQYPNDPNIIRNGSAIHKNIVGNFSGISGDVRINKNGTREPVYNVLGLDARGNSQLLFIIQWQENVTVNS